MTTVANLVANLTANTTGLTSGLKSAERDVQSFSGNTSKAFGKLGKAAVAGAAVAAAAVVAGAAKSVAAFADFERGMNEVFTLLPGITGEAMSEMEGQVKDLSKEFGVLPDEVVPALYQAISAGVPSDNVFDFMETATKASIAGVTELETAVDGISSVINAFGAETIDATEASDLMFTAVRLGKTTFDELSRSLFQVNPVAAGLGIEFGDITAALAAMTAQGTPTSVATTQLRQALVELGKEGTDAFDTFKTATGQTFPDFIAGGGNVEGAFDAMKTHADDMGVGVGDLFGSVEAGMGVISLTSESGAVAFGDAMDEMQTAAGSTDTAFDTMNQGLSRSWDKIKATFAVGLIDVGEKLSPFVTQFADWFERTLPSAIDTFMGVVDGAVTVFTNFFDGLAAIRDVIALIPGPVKIATAAVVGLGAALVVLSAHPVVAALVAVGAAIAVIGSEMNKLPEADDAFFDEFVGAQGLHDLEELGFTIDDLNTAIFGSSSDWVSFKDAAGGAADAINAKVPPAVAHLEKIRAAAQGTSTMTDAMLDMKRGVTETADAVGLAFGDLPDSISDSVGDIGDVLGDGTDDFQEWEQEFYKTMTNTETIAEKATEGMVTAFEGAGTQIVISVEEMMANIIATAAQAQEFESLMQELADRGLFALRDELDRQGPLATDAIGNIADDSGLAWEANLRLEGRTTDEIAEIASTRNVAAAARAAAALARATESAFNPNLLATITIKVKGGVGSGGVFEGVDLPTVSSSTVIGTSQGSTPTIGGGHKLAAGGIVTSPTIATIGEAGEPEAVISLSRAAEFGFGTDQGPVNNFYIERVETDDLPGDISEGLTLASVAAQVDMFGDF